MENKSKLKKVLKTTDMTALAFGAAIGWAWVVSSGDWLLTGGTLGAILGFVLGGVMVFFIGVTYAELCPAMPNCGGEHVFSMRALGFNWSFVCSWALALSYLGVVGFEACSLPSVLSYIIPGMAKESLYVYTVAGLDIYLPFIIVGVAGAALLTFINFIGVEFSSGVQKLFTGIILTVGILIIIGAFMSGSMTNVQPLFANGKSGPIGCTLAVAVLTPFFMVGFDVVPQAAEEAIVAPKKLAHLMLISIVMAATWYCIILLAVSMLVPHEQLNGEGLCTANALVNAWHGNQIAKYIVIIGGGCGILTTWNAFLTAGSRVLYSMGLSGMLPKWFTYIHPKFKTPSNAVLFIGGLSAITAFFGKQALIWISNAASLSTVVAYGLVAVSFLVLRRTEPDMHRPYKVKNYKVMGTLAITFAAFMFILYMPGMPSCLGKAEWIIILLWVILGVPMYLTARSNSPKYLETLERKSEMVLKHIAELKVKQAIENKKIKITEKIDKVNIVKENITKAKKKKIKTIKKHIKVAKKKK